ncbi:class I SAM-dependent RNA methyltransferase [Intrasporangium calvum]|uniref:class I SAM-dependent RNA methyltransferase n=1 Tax=Intrasporangium calvum TaxID=53358 RepID=UPI000DF6236A|nr:TRAM domain-containing protein [Intrasporangium calvum]AXG13468.1 class I SAM-dependent RNA methyltransferase [Intrasporangium calvum]
MNARRPRERPAGRPSLAGVEWTVDVGPVAHGGHCVARHEGQVIFVRHALPGERVVARVTEGRIGDRFVRADAVEVLTASPHRVVPPCPYAAARVCGGCDFQHATLPYQRELKAAVVREQLARLAGLDVDPEVQPVPGDEDGLRWRTRVEFAVNRSGRAGLRGHRSRHIVPVDDCLIATRGVVGSGVLDTDWSGCTAVDVVDAAHPDEPVLVPLPVPPGADRAGGLVGERVSDGAWEVEYVVAARGFWQVHPGAATTFLSRVVALLAPGPGDRVLDLYAGAGLFTVRLADLIEPDGHVLGVEGDARAVADGVRNTDDRANVEWRTNRVERELASLVAQGISADLVVLDPPRTGAGPAVMADLAALQPRRVVYVACDPAALARDVQAAGAHGYRLAHVEAWDAFPMTHHVECIAVLEPGP